MDEHELLRSRLKELAVRSSDRNILEHTGFLDAESQNIYLRTEKELPACTRVLAGGYDGAERKTVLFVPDYMDEEEALKKVISLVHIGFPPEKFREEIGHRDILGAVMNLGIERDRIGDILVSGDHALLFCLGDIAAHVTGNLIKVRHSCVKCSMAELSDVDITPVIRDISVNIASERLDALISAVFRISRSKAAALIAGECVYLDGRIDTQASRNIMPGTKVSVRGKGRFVYRGTEKTTHKGRLFAGVGIYG